MSMDYEKAYKDALERAKEELKTCGSMDCAAARQVFKLFPELAESEDEKIRTRLIVLVEAFSQGKYKDEMLAYLEKQKEQKPAEWSEEDKTMLERCISKMANIIPIPGKHGFTNMSFEKHTDEKLAAWLKSLPERFDLQPKQEWSEEDSVNKIHLVDFLWGEINLGKKERDELAKWVLNLFESLHPQPHWKPSEEQMQALKHAYSMMNGQAGTDLANLYYDLKKLM